MTLSQFFASTNHFGDFERPVPASEKVTLGCEGVASSDYEFEDNEEPKPCAGVWICLCDNMETTIVATGGGYAKNMADEMNLAMIQAREGEQTEEDDEEDVSESVAGSTGASSSTSKSSWETAKMLSASIKGSIKSRGSKLAMACKSVVRKMTKRIVSSKNTNAATAPVAA